MESLVVMDYTDLSEDSISVQVTRIPVLAIDKIIQYKYTDTLDAYQVRRDVYKRTHKTDFSVDGENCRVFMKGSDKVYATFKSEVDRNNLQDLYYVVTI